MGFLIVLLLLLNIGVAAGLLLRSFLARGGVEVNHVVLFATGFLFYWIVPVLVGVIAPAGNNVLAGWFQQYQMVPETTIVLYLSFCLLFLGAFSLGSFVRSCVSVPSTPTLHVPFDRRLINLFFVPCLLLVAYFCFRLRNEFFAGYHLIFDAGGMQRGPFFATTLFIISLLLIYAIRVEQTTTGNERVGQFRRLLVNHWAALVAFLLLATIALGGRMHFVTGAVIFTTYWSVFVRRFSRWGLMFGVLAGILVAGLVGTVRFGFSSANINFLNLFYSIVLEPVFTSFSLFSFLAENPLELLNLPVQLASQFLNLVPTVVLPNKVGFMLEPQDLGYSLTSPFGALSAFPSFMINFGVAGTAVVLFLFGWWLQHLRGRGSLLSRLMYVMICGFLPFSFFRDPFYSSIIKSIVQLSILMPVLVVLMLHVASVVGSQLSSRDRQRGPLTGTRAEYPAG